MSWLRITLECDPAQIEQVSDCLAGSGAQSITWQDAGHSPVYEPAPGQTITWNRTLVEGLYAADTDLDALRLLVKTRLGSQLGESLRWDNLPDQAWERTCLEHWQPMLFGDRLWIHPGNQMPVDDGRSRLQLDPGLAFGTGTHPTTALCLEWLTSHNLVDRTIIDYGCGSGILACAAVRLGARHAWGVDHDPQALQATTENARRNQLARRVSVADDRNQTIPVADVLLANILSGTLIDLLPKFHHLVRPRGEVFLSGVLEHQVGQVLAAYEPAFGPGTVSTRDGWAGIGFSRPRA